MLKCVFLSNRWHSTVTNEGNAALATCAAAAQPYHHQHMCWSCDSSWCPGCWTCELAWCPKVFLHLVLCAPLGKLSVASDTGCLWFAFLWFSIPMFALWWLLFLVSVMNVLPRMEWPQESQKQAQPLGWPLSHQCPSHSGNVFWVLQIIFKLANKQGQTKWLYTVVWKSPFVVVGCHVNGGCAWFVTVSACI